jgi:hypothetical protein
MPKYAKDGEMLVSNQKKLMFSNPLASILNMPKGSKPGK